MIETHLNKPPKQSEVDPTFFKSPKRRIRLLDRSQNRRPSMQASRIPGLMKLLLPAIALAIVGVTFAWPQMMLDQRKFQIGETSVKRVGVDGLFIENPRYVGQDKADRPYQISAINAAQKHKSDDRILLSMPKADVFLNSSGWLAINSQKGVYYRTSETIDLLGGVTVFYNKGYEFTTKSLTLDLKNGTGFSNDPVSAHGLTGEIQSEGFKVSHHGTRVIFTGNSQAILRTSRGDNF